MEILLPVHNVLFNLISTSLFSAPSHLFSCSAATLPNLRRPVSSSAERLSPPWKKRLRRSAPSGAKRWLIEERRAGGRCADDKCIRPRRLELNLVLTDSQIARLNGQNCCQLTLVTDNYQIWSLSNTHTYTLLSLGQCVFRRLDFSLWVENESFYSYVTLPVVWKA